MICFLVTIFSIGLSSRNLSLAPISSHCLYRPSGLITKSASNNALKPYHGGKEALGFTATLVSISHFLSSNYNAMLVSKSTDKEMINRNSLPQPLVMKRSKI